MVGSFRSGSRWLTTVSTEQGFVSVYGYIDFISSWLLHKGHQYALPTYMVFYQRSHRLNGMYIVFTWHFSVFTWLCRKADWRCHLACRDVNGLCRTRQRSWQRPWDQDKGHLSSWLRDLTSTWLQLQVLVPNS